jgi:hypothetical protein
MLRLAICALLAAAATPAVLAQSTGYTPAAGDVPPYLGGGSIGIGWTGSAGGPAFWGRPQREYGMPARPDQIRVGYAVYSTEGGLIGRVAYTDSHVVVVRSPHYALRLPAKAFGVKKSGLLLPLSPKNFESLAKLHGARAS